MSTARLQEHQKETLRKELAGEAYRGLSAEAAYALLTSPDVAKRLAATRYLKQGDLPGFPNKVRRADFDAAWS